MQPLRFGAIHYPSPPNLGCDAVELSLKLTDAHLDKYPHLVAEGSPKGSLGEITLSRDDYHGRIDFYRGGPSGWTQMTPTIAGELTRLFEELPETDTVDIHPAVHLNGAPRDYPKTALEEIKSKFLHSLNRFL